MHASKKKERKDGRVRRGKVEFTDWGYSSVLRLLAGRSQVRKQASQDREFVGESASRRPGENVDLEILPLEMVSILNIQRISRALSQLDLFAQ